MFGTLEDTGVLMLAIGDELDLSDGSNRVDVLGSGLSENAVAWHGITFGGE